MKMDMTWHMKNESLAFRLPKDQFATMRAYSAMASRCTLYVALVWGVGVLIAPGAMGQPVFLQRMVYQRPQPAETEPARRVAELIGRLSDESSVKRQAAARALLRMGPAVEPQLQWARQHGELGGQRLSWPPYHVPEVNQWRADSRHLLPWHAQNELDVLISHLDEQRRSKTSLITLHHKDALLTNVLCDLGRQADADVAVGKCPQEFFKGLTMLFAQTPNKLANQAHIPRCRRW